MKQDYPKPIAPPPELMQQWLNADAEKGLFAEPLAAKAAQWGADQELEACCEYMERWVPAIDGTDPSKCLRAARRPKPPSLKEQALQELEQLRGDANSMGMGFDAPAIRRALEQLDD